MRTYLQRLYDRAAAAPPGAASALGAQRSQSPLVDADQRLAMPEFSRNFTLGAPPEVGESEELAAPLPDPGVAVEAPRPPPASPRRTRGEAARAKPSRVVPEPSAPPDETFAQAAAFEHHSAPKRVTPPLPQIVETAIAEAARGQPPVDTPAVALTASRQAVSPPPPAAPHTAPFPVPDDPAVWEPLSPPRSEARPVEVAPPRSETAPAPPAITQAAAPDLQAAPMAPLRPPPPAPLDPLPPDPAAIDWDRVEARIADLVASHAAPPKPKSGVMSVTAAAPAAPAAGPPSARPRTAEAASVIGRIERPTRHTRLFGARLR